MSGRGRRRASQAKSAIYSAQVSTDSGGTNPSIATEAGEAQAATTAGPPTPSPRRPWSTQSGSICERYRELIVEVLGRGCNAMAIRHDLVDDHGFTSRHASVRRFVVTLRGTSPRGLPRSSRRSARFRSNRFAITASEDPVAIAGIDNRRAQKSMAGRIASQHQRAGDRQTDTDNEEIDSKPQLAIGPGMENGHVRHRSQTLTVQSVSGANLSAIFWALRSIARSNVVKGKPMPDVFDVPEPVWELDGWLEQSPSSGTSALMHRRAHDYRASARN